MYEPRSLHIPGASSVNMYVRTPMMLAIKYTILLMDAFGLFNLTSNAYHPSTFGCFYFFWYLGQPTDKLCISESLTILLLLLTSCYCFSGLLFQQHIHLFLLLLLLLLVSTLLFGFRLHCRRHQHHTARKGRTEKCWSLLHFGHWQKVLFN